LRASEHIVKEALDLDLQACEIAAHAKTMLLTFADSDALHDLARWDKKPLAADPDQQRALLKVVDSIRRQIDTKADSVPELVGLGLMFGWFDQTHPPARRGIVSGTEVPSDL
jgi:hypothetical protein